MIKEIYPFIVREAMLPIGDIVLKTSISKNLRFLNETDTWTRLKLDLYREKLFKKMLFYAYNYVPYYREEYDRRGIDIGQINGIKDIYKLPIIDKKIIKSNFEKFIPQKIDLINSRLDSTGGSTGIPMKYYVSLDAYSWSKAVLYRMYKRANYKVGQKMVTLAGSSISSRKNMSIKKAIFYNVVERSKKISSFNLSDEKMKNYYEIIKTYNPVALRGYANALFEFASFIKEKNLPPIEIKKIFSAAEKLELHKRDLIENVFQTKIFDGYGAADGTVFAHECEEHNGLHMDEEVGITEIVNSRGEVIQKGRGEIITTSLVNFSFPFIRYKVGDLGQISEDKCTCNRPSRLLKKIIGRSHEFIVLSNGEKVHGEFFSHAVREITPDIGQFAVHQFENGSVNVKVVPNKVSSVKLNLLKKSFEKKLNNLDLKFEEVKEIKLSPSGKWNFITSDYSS
tara:strand:- start:373 stop:1731 length:1359 start_codon:yes stop_codon:yes gene_type:complete